MLKRPNDSERLNGSSHTNVNVFYVIAIIAIVGVSIVGYLIFQSISEENIRSSVFEQYRQRQIVYASSLAQNMQSDLNMLMSKLQTVALSKQVQDGDFASAQVTSLLSEIYDDANAISDIDGVYLVNNDNAIVNYINPSIEGSEVIGYDVSTLPPFFEYQDNLQSPTFSKGYVPSHNSTLRIALIHPVYNFQNGEYIGAVGLVLVLDSFFSHYGNIQDINSQYLAALDSEGTVLASAARDIVGLDVFSDYVHNLHADKSAYDHYRTVMNGSSSVADFGFKTGARLNVGEPIILNEKPTYSLFVVTPTAAIYSEIDRILQTHRTESFLFLGVVSAAISLSVFFLVRWNNLLTKAVMNRTRELDEANKSLESHDNMQKEFINIAAHELRTPVQPLLTSAELLEVQLDGKDKTEVTKDDIELIIRNAKRLERLTSDILQVSRIESQSLKLNRENVNLQEKIRNVIADVRSYIRSDQHLQIIFEPNTEPIIVEADKAKLFEVLLNLLRNSIKFTQKGTITVSLTKENGFALVSIKDSGKGIHPDIVPRLFEKFATKGTEEGGTGLGLFISKAIVEAHGGKIWAENNNDERGATFTFTLPYSTIN